MARKGAALDALPPRLPDEPAARERAIMLLGNRAREPEMKPKVRRELEALVGAYPDQETAQRWKLAMQALRRAAAAHQATKEQA